MHDDNDIWASFENALSLRNDNVGDLYSKDERDIVTYLENEKSRVITCDACGASFEDKYISDGFLVCTTCGLVKESIIDSGAEWRCFSNSSGGKDTSGIRCGNVANTLLPGTQLNTFIGGKDKRLQRVHQWTNLTSKERNLHQIFKEFESIGASNGLSKNIICTATDLYSKLYTEMENKNCGVKRCNVRQGLKAACLYYACKQLNTPRERREIAEMLGNTTKIVTKGCNSFLDIMGTEYVKLDPFEPEDFVSRYSQLLQIPYQYQHKLMKIVQYVSGLSSLSDNTPTSVTTACIYFLSIEYSLGYTKEQIREKCGSSPVIITKTFNKFIDYRNDILAACE